MVSLTEKVGAKEENTKEAVGTEMAGVSAAQLSSKVEDRLSGVSAVVDEDCPQIVDSGDSISYFASDKYRGCMEEEDGSDDGQSYFPDVFVAAQNQQPEEPLDWWVWSS